MLLYFISSITTLKYNQLNFIALKVFIMTHRNFHKYFTLYFILFGVAISSFGTVTSYMFQLYQMQEHTNKKAREIYEIKINTILRPALENMQSLVHALGNNTTILDFLKTNDSHKKAKLVEIFLAIANTQNHIMQIRLLSSKGHERIRIERDKEQGSALVVEAARLQDKSHRDYFQQVSKMKTQSVWFSRMDLNIEYREVQIPHKPTIRIAMPLFNDKKFAGMLIVNLCIKKLLASIGTSSAFEHFIINQEQNYIWHPNPKFSFNQYTHTPRPLREDFPNGLDANNLYLYPLGDILQNEDNATLILKTKNRYKNRLINEKIKTATIVLMLTIILSLTLAMVISKTPIKLQNALLEAYDKLNRFGAIIDEYIITATTQKDSTIIDVSSAFIRSSGYSRDELIGKKMNIIHESTQDKALFKDLWRTIMLKQTWIGEIKNRKKSGETYWLEQHIIPILNSEQKIVSFISLGVDITAKKELEKLSSIDKLTSLYNRRMLEEFMHQEIAVQKREAQGLSLIMIDIDHFKSVNDTYGHQIGDVVLAQTAQIIRQNSRKSDIKGRYGGEEFMVICPQTDSQSALVLAQKIRVAVEQFVFEEVGHKTISLGVASFDNACDDSVSFIKKADTALYWAKEKGRNIVVVFD